MSNIQLILYFAVRDHNHNQDEGGLFAYHHFPSSLQFLQAWELAPFKLSDFQLKAFCKVNFKASLVPKICFSDQIFTKLKLLYYFNYITSYIKVLLTLKCPKVTKLAQQKCNLDKFSKIQKNHKLRITLQSPLFHHCKYLLTSAVVSINQRMPRMI